MWKLDKHEGGGCPRSETKCRVGVIMAIKISGSILLDDEHFLLIQSVNQPSGNCNGFLLRRFRFSPAVAERIECVGTYERRPGNGWYAGFIIRNTDNSVGGYREIGEFEERLDAIYALWHFRHEAPTPSY